MNKKSRFNSIAMGLCFVLTMAWAQDTSNRVFNIYTHSVVEPELFDDYVASLNWDEETRSCLDNLYAAYGPIVDQHMNYCKNQPPQLQGNCMQQAPPRVHVGDWVGSMILKLNGAKWCDTSAGRSACLGKQLMGPVVWGNTVRAFFPQWQQFLQCN